MERLVNSINVKIANICGKKVAKLMTREEVFKKIWSFIMRPVRRARVRKSRSARAFRRQSARTKGMNLRMPMRGGFRI